MKKETVIGVGVGIPVVLFMVIIGGGGHTDLEFERENETTIEEPKQTESVDTLHSQYSLQECSGNSKCFIGTVTKVIDGDTIHVDDQSVRFALTLAPELKGYGGIDSKKFIETICPVGSIALVDEDDGQPPEGHSRIIGVVHCNDMILNKELLDADLGNLTYRFCDSSEFATSSWAQKHGCNTETMNQDDTSQ